jgi:hypothetical protein
MEELFGCWQEARRADKVADILLSIRTTLSPSFYENISAVLKEVESASRLLRDLYDLFPIYRSRVPVVLYYLNVVLPTFQKTMRDMLIYIDNEDLPARTQWSLMSQRLADQGGMTLAQRFVMYCEALVQTVRLLSRCGIALLIFFSVASRGPLVSVIGANLRSQQIPIIRSHDPRTAPRQTHAFEEASRHSRYLSPHPT